MRRQTSTVDQSSEDDAPRLQAALAGLVGLRLAKAFRWHEIDCFTFGPPVRHRSPDGSVDVVPRFVLDLQCAWGLLRGGGALVGRYNAMVLEVDQDGRRLYEENDCAHLLRLYMAEDPEGRRKVTGVRLGRGSDLAIALDDGSVLEVRALRCVDPTDNKLHSEYWRLIDNASEKGAHHVVRRGPTDAPPWSAGVGPWSEEADSPWDSPPSVQEAPHAAVTALAGEPSRGSYRHDGTEWFRFGPVVEFPRREGGTGVSPRYGLRLNCEWALVREGRVLTGYEDCKYPPHEEEEGKDEAPSETETVAGIDLTWKSAPTGDEPRLRDTLLRDFFAEAGGVAEPRIVTSARLSGGWDHDIVLDDGTTLEVRPRHHLAEGWSYWELWDREKPKGLLADADGVTLIREEPTSG
jgi:hypothetical protein